MRVRCLNNGKIFNGVIEASEWANTSSIDIVRQILGGIKFAGAHPISKSPLRWASLDGSTTLLNSVPIKCITNGKTFASVAEACSWAKTHNASIINQEKGLTEYAGNDPITGEPLKWEKLDKSIFTECSLIKCINGGKVFTSLAEASEWANTHFIAIGHALKGEIETAGRHPKTGEPLRWEYVEEYSLDTKETKSINEDDEKNDSPCLNYFITSYKRASKKQKDYITGLLRNSDLYELQNNVDINKLSLNEAKMIISVLIGDDKFDKYSKKYLKIKNKKGDVSMSEKKLSPVSEISKDDEILNSGYGLIVGDVEEQMIITLFIVGARFEFIYHPDIHKVAVYRISSRISEKYGKSRYISESVFVETFNIELKNEDELKEFAINYMRNNVINRG